MPMRQVTHVQLSFQWLPNPLIQILLSLVLFRSEAQPLKENEKEAQQPQVPVGELTARQDSGFCKSLGRYWLTAKWEGESLRLHIFYLQLQLKTKLLFLSFVFYKVSAFIE